MGNTGNKAAKITMSRRPHTKLGTAMPSVPRPTAPASSHERRRQTDSTPSPSPATRAMARAARASSSVAGNRSRMTRRASCWSHRERPKRPRASWPRNAPYWAHQGPARPKSRRMRSRSSAVAPAGAMRRAGSPGTTRRITKTRTLTPHSERTASRRRASRKRPAVITARLRPGHFLRDEHAGGEGLVGELLLHDDGLHDLVERRHVPLLHRIARGAPGRGHPPGLVALLEDRVDQRREILGLPDAERPLGRELEPDGVDGVPGGVGPEVQGQGRDALALA